MSRAASTIPAFISVVLAFAAITPIFAQQQVKPPWESGRYGGSKSAYARELWQRYKNLQSDLNKANSDLQIIKNQLSAYTGTGLFGGMAMGYNDPDTVIRKANLQREAARLSRMQQEIETEWDSWCAWKLLLGPLSDSGQTTKVPYLDHSTWPATLRYRDVDRVDYRIQGLEEREREEKEGRSATRPGDSETPRPSSGLGKLIASEGATIENPARVQSEGSLKPGMAITTHSGSFSGKGDDHGYSVGPFSVSTPCRVEARITGGPAVPNVWSLGNSGTGIVLTHLAKKGARAAAGEEVLRVGLASEGRPTATEATASGDIFLPGELVMWVGNPRGAGPLSGGNFPQSFSVTVKVTEVFAKSPALNGGELIAGDTIAAGSKPTIIILRDGSRLIVKPNSAVKLTEPRPGIIRINVERGGCRVSWKGQRSDYHPIEVAVGGRLVRPEGTDFEVTEAGAGSSVVVYEGAVQVISEAGVQRISAGQQLSMSGNQITDAATADPPAADGVPIDDAHFYAGLPQPYGQIGAQFNNDGMADDWLWEDPDSDCTLQTPQPGVLRITVPPDNDLWDRRTNAPRLLHKVTGDFDIEASLDTQTEAKNWTSTDFLIKSPGSYMGQHLKQLQGDAGANYWLNGLCGGIGEADGKQMGVLNRSALNELHKAPAGPVRVRMARRGDQWCSYWSPDGTRWDLMSAEEAALPQTVWVGWVFKRQAWDGMRDKPSVFTLSNVRLVTEPSGTMPTPEWEFSTYHGDVQTNGRNVRLGVRAEKPGFAKVFSGGEFQGDFDIQASYDAGTWEHSPGASRAWRLGVTTLDEKSVFYVGYRRTDGCTPLRADSDFIVDGRGQAYNWERHEAPRGNLRIARKDGALTAWYWKDGAWAKISRDGLTCDKPMRLSLAADTLWEARQPTALSVDFTIGEVQAWPARPKPEADETVADDQPGRPAQPAQPVAVDQGGRTPVTVAAPGDNRVVDIVVTDGTNDAGGALRGPSKIKTSFSFNNLPQDTNLVGVWKRDGQEFQRSNVTLGGTGTAWFSVSTTRNGGFETGSYAIQLMIGETIIAEKRFAVTGQ